MGIPRKIVLVRTRERTAGRFFGWGTALSRRRRGGWGDNNGCPRGWLGCRDIGDRRQAARRGRSIRGADGWCHRRLGASRRIGHRQRNRIVGRNGGNGWRYRGRCRRWRARGASHGRKPPTGRDRRWGFGTRRWTYQRHYRRPFRQRSGDGIGCRGGVAVRGLSYGRRRRGRDGNAKRRRRWYWRRRRRRRRTSGHHDD